MVKLSNSAAVRGLMGGAMLSVLQISGLAAQQAGITVLSQGENFAVQYGDMHRQNSLGGRTVLSVNGGEGGGITYSLGEAHQQPMIPHLAGGGESQVITYSLPAPSGSLIARTSPTAPVKEVAEATSPRR